MSERTGVDANQDGGPAMTTLHRDATIIDLNHVLEQLSPEVRALFHRIFRVTNHVGALAPPLEMHPWIEKQFGSLQAVQEQRVVRVTNLMTLDDSFFNELRARRPMDMKNGFDLEEFSKEIPNDPLAAPLTGTPADTFGRIESQYAVTASNVAKPDALSGLVVFNDRNPLHFTREQVIDYITTATRWAEAGHAVDPSAKYYLFMWNCLWRAGASLVHGHAQMMLGRDMHYGKIEHLRQTALRYRQIFAGNYFEDLYRAHEAVGAGFELDGVRVLAHLTPVKEKETLLLADRLDENLMSRIYDALACLRDQLGVHSFNLTIAMPPLGGTDEDWSGFPVLVRVVDRGDHQARTSDIGAMELYAASIISSDPMSVARRLRECMTGNG
ncbi:MAG: hypothetical protein NTZ05_06295 [Chloroflexi bacterium]|nr:hypothetical protein [Chloroflexota bacterium]